MEFVAAARLAGLSVRTLNLTPEVVGARLMEQSKALARALEAAKLAVGHRKCLEAIARALGFADWHAFQTLCKRAVAGADPPEQGLRALASAAVLLCQIPEDSPAAEATQRALVQLSEKLARHLRTDANRTLDCISRHVGGAAWKTLCTRRPEDSPLPLYRFEVSRDLFTERQLGTFRSSPACRVLVEKLDELLSEGYEEMSPERKTNAHSFVTRILALRPDFLDGWLALNEMDELDASQDTKTIVARYRFAVEQAEAMIPPTFRGHIRNDVAENRAYHGLVLGGLRLEALAGSRRDATSLARRIFRRDPREARAVVRIFGRSRRKAAGMLRGNDEQP